jgi:hypothetical protein
VLGEITSIGINQLSVSATRWQHRSQMVKNLKIANNSTPIEAREKLRTFLETSEF